MKRTILLIGLVLLLAVPAIATTEDIQVMRATYRSGICQYNYDRTHIECWVVSQDVTGKIATIALGNPIFKFDTNRTHGGVFTQHGLAWEMPRESDRNFLTSVVTYMHDGVPHKLSVRDGCWYNLVRNRVFCPSTVLPMSVVRSGDDMMLDDFMMG